MLIPIIIIELASIESNAQATIDNNFAGGAAYLGWDGTVGVPLTIEHRAANQPIRFLNFDNNVGVGVVAPKMELTVGGLMIDDAGVALPNDGLRLWNNSIVLISLA